jgi:hypothetical protein
VKSSLTAKYVTQPGGCLEKVFVFCEGGGEAAGACGHASDVRPAPGKCVLQEVAGEGSAQAGRECMSLRLRS